MVTKDKKAPASLPPALEKRKAVEDFIGKSGKVLLVFLAGSLVVLLAAYGRELFDILFPR